jgi:pimeloyl-ACP methyl ester carboxylesterase
MTAQSVPDPLGADVPVREDHVEVPGARLKFRLSGRPGTLPLLVFENGWGASHHYWAWIERVLAPQTQTLFYDRAGIGASVRSGARSAGALSAQFAALLDALGVHQPVLLVGHSYGGLMAALHAAQQSERLRAIIQLDPTPEINHPVIDQQLGWTRQIGRLARLCARLGVRDPVFCPAARHLPAPESGQIVSRAFNSVASLTGGIEELDLLPAIRAAIAAREPALPRLTISADAASEFKGMARLLVSPEKARKLLDLIHGLHREAAARHRGLWESTPHTHGDMVFTAAGGVAMAARILDYARSLED